MDERRKRLIEKKLQGIIKKQAHDKRVADGIDKANGAGVTYTRVCGTVIRRRRTA